MRNRPFTRPTIIAANEFVAAEVRTHTQIAYSDEAGQ